MPVGRTIARVPAGCKRTFAREALLVIGITHALRIDPHQRGRGLRVEVLELQQRPALLRQREQRSAFFLLHEVVGTKAVADIPADDLLARTHLPCAEVARRVELVEACERAGRTGLEMLARQQQVGAQHSPAATQLGLGDGGARWDRRDVRRERVRIGERALRVGTARVPAQPKLATGVVSGEGRGCNACSSNQRKPASPHISPTPDCAPETSDSAKSRAPPSVVATHSAPAFPCGC